jgi:hypothetical protein
MLTASKFGSVQAGLMPLYSILSHQSKKIGRVIPWFWKICSSINICPIGNSVIVVCVYAFNEERALNSAYSISILRISLSFAKSQLNLFLICGSGVWSLRTYIRGRFGPSSLGWYNRVESSLHLCLKQSPLG